MRLSIISIMRERTELEIFRDQISKPRLKLELYGTEYIASKMFV